MVMNREERGREGKRREECCEATKARRAKEFSPLLVLTN
jgi:hypothetical protein